MPSKAGRYIGSAGVAGDAVFVVCEDATPTISNKPTNQNVPNRMAQIGKRKARSLQERTGEILCRDWERVCRGNLANNPVTPEVIDKCVTRLQWMQRAIDRGRLEQGAQLHKMMAGAA